MLKNNTFKLIWASENKLFSKIFKMKVLEDTKCKPGRPYWICIGCSLWQLMTSDRVMEVDKLLRSKSYKSMHLEFILSNVDVMNDTWLFD